MTTATGSGLGADAATGTRSGALDPELFAQIKGIQIRTQRLVNNMLAGDYASAFRGRGMELEEIRNYHPGDDVRSIHWKATARMGAPFVKVHREERELTVMLMVDVSSSQAFGSGTKFKSEIAAEVAAILAYTAIRSNDRVGLIIFSDRIEHYTPPNKGRGHVWQVIRDVLTFRAPHRSTDLSVALEYLNKVMRRRCVAFMVSDFIDDHYEDSLRVAANRHDLTAISIADPRESALPAVGLLALEDAESGELTVVDTADLAVRNALRVRQAQARDQTLEIFRTSGVGHIHVSTETSPIEPLIRYFRHRESRRVRR